MYDFKFSVLGPTWAKHGDRWMLGGYHDGWSVEKMIETTASIEGLKGIELTFPFLINKDNYKEVNGTCKKHGIEISTIMLAISSFKEHYRGALISNDPEIRNNCINLIKEGMDIAHELGVNRCNLWLGREGYDYPFQLDYEEATELLVDALKQCANHNPEVEINIEYKLRDPKAHLLASTAARTLLLIQDTGCDNLGVLMDTGHTLYAYENMGETIYLLNKANKLFHFHLNDNHRIQDDDMVVGTIHFFEFVEALYWLVRVGYKGWVSFDPHPCGEDETRSVEESYRFAIGVLNMFEKVGLDKIGELLKNRRSMEVFKLLNEYLLFR